MNETTTTDKKAACNSGFAKKRVQWLIEHSTSHQLLCWVDSFELRNPLLRKAANRWEKSPFGTLFPIGSRYTIAVKTTLLSHDVLTSTALTDFLRE
jgi:hypothetical protein